MTLICRGCDEKWDDGSSTIMFFVCNKCKEHLIRQSKININLQKTP